MSSILACMNLNVNGGRARTRRSWWCWETKVNLPRTASCSSISRQTSQIPTSWVSSNHLDLFLRSVLWPVLWPTTSPLRQGVTITHHVYTCTLPLLASLILCFKRCHIPPCAMKLLSRNVSSKILKSCCVTLTVWREVTRPDSQMYSAQYLRCSQWRCTAEAHVVVVRDVVLGVRRIVVEVRQDAVKNMIWRDFLYF